jgi:hypothetical protein
MNWERVVNCSNSCLQRPGTLPLYIYLFLIPAISYDLRDIQQLRLKAQANQYAVYHMKLLIEGSTS